MDPDKSAKLDRLLFIGKAKKWGAVAAVGIAIAGFVAISGSPDVPMQVTLLEGVVKSWTRQQTQWGSGGLVMVVELADQQEIIVQQKIARSPRVGAKIKFQKIQTTSGKVSYRWQP